VQLGAGNDDRQPRVRRQQPGLRDPADDRERLRPVDHRAGQQVVHQLDRNQVEHDRGQDLVDAPVGLERAGDGTPDRPAGGPGQQHQRNEHEARQVRQHERGRGAGQAAHDELSFAADVEHIGPERDADAHADQQQRHRLDRGARQLVGAAEGAADQRVVAGQGIGAHRRDDHGPDDQRPDGGGRQDQPAIEHRPPAA